MAQEAKRWCGYRHVGGFYLCGEYIPVPCDRLPYPLDICPVCGGGIKVSRGFTKINPLRLFGPHDSCTDQRRPCFMCDPKDEPAFIMGVGAQFYKTPGDFLAEAHDLGVSKRIPSREGRPLIPKELELGKTIVYLAHPKACQVKETSGLQKALAILGGDRPEQPQLLDCERVEHKHGIFTVFIPQRVEKLIWESQATPDDLGRLEKRGITPVIIKDGDMDHA
jgi:hypothetical protein